MRILATLALIICMVIPVEAPEKRYEEPDIETAIYDALYKSFLEVEGWEVTREGNNIRISVKEEKQ